MQFKIGNISINRVLALAPMDEITDSPFRQICRRLGADLVFSEFVSSEGLIRQARKSIQKLCFSPEERPIGIQIYGHNPESMLKAAEFAQESEPDFIDINIGCPVRKLVSKGSCAALLKNLPLLKEIIRAVVRKTKVPVTSKMRIGWDKNSIVIPDALRMMADEGIKAISIHARTREEGYSGTANWAWIKKAVESVSIPVIGNGDIRTIHDAKKHFSEIPGLAGIMIGRGAIGNPWIFRAIQHFLSTGNVLPTPSIGERIDLLKAHLQLSVEKRGEELGVLVMRKHFSGYLKGLYEAAKIRSQLMQKNTLLDTLDILDNYLFKLENYAKAN